MQKIIVITAFFLSIFAFSQEVPKVIRKSFSKEALQQTLKATDGKSIKVSTILAKHKGEILVIDIWASWCKDCISALPKAKELEANNPEVNFVFFSLDRSEDGWKKGIEKFGLQEQENYWFSDGWKNNFNNYIDLNWIPRYLVIDQNSKIAKYYAITPEDPEIQKTIDSLKAH